VLRFERIELNLAQWQHTLSRFSDRAVFQTPTWLQFLAGTQKGELVLANLQDDGKVVGYFTGLIVNRLGIRVLGSPFPGWTTEHMGLNLEDGVPRQAAIRALLPFAFEKLRCLHLEVVDRKLLREDVSNAGLTFRFAREFELALTRSDDELFGQMEPACRRNLRKALRCGVSVEEAHDVAFAEEYYAQLRGVFHRQGLVPTYDISRVRELIKHVLPTGMLLLLRARNTEGQCIATGIYLAMNELMYFWGGASCRAQQILRPNELLMWHAIKYWKARGITTFAMGGGGRYKQKFGAREIFVPRLIASQYPFLSRLRDAARFAVKARQRCWGWSPVQQLRH
jgi:hypothetical protein